MEKNTKISLRINDQEKEKIERAAARRDISVAQLLREAVREYLLNKEKGNDQGIQR